MTGSSWPLGPEHLERLNAVLGRNPLLQEVLQKCVECGIPCQDRLDALQQQVDLCAALKARFFPDET